MSCWTGISSIPLLTSAPLSVKSAKMILFRYASKTQTRRETFVLIAHDLLYGLQKNICEVVSNSEVEKKTRAEKQYLDT